MATLPTVPSFAFQEVPTVAKLNQLASAVSFVTKVPIVISLKKTTTQSVAANTATAVTWNVSETDSDSMHSNTTNPSRLVSQTQGYYKVRASVPLSITTTSANYQVFFRQTTGTNNPLGSGHTQIFGAASRATGTNTSDFDSPCISSITPCLYVGDYVEVVVLASAATTIEALWEETGVVDSAGNNDGAACLYGVYAFEGP